MADTSNLKSILLMTAPVVVLGGLALSLQNRQPAVFIPPAPFQIFIKEVRVVPPRPQEVQDGYDTKVEVELGARGRGVGWWKTGFGSYISISEGQLVAHQAGATRVVGVPWHVRPHLQGKPPRWITTYLLKLAPIPANVGEVRLRHRIQLEDRNAKYGNPLWLDTTVRRNGQRTLVPKVSRDPKLTLERWTLEELQPVDLKPATAGTNRVNWRLGLLFRKKGSPLEVANSGMISDDLKIVDANGQKGSLNASIAWWNSPSDLSDGFMATGPAPKDPKRSYLVHEYDESGVEAPPGTKLKPPLWIEGEASWDKNWPLKFKFPFRDAQGRTLVTDRPTNFRVLSTQIRTASPGEKASNGADTFVDVVLGANDGQTDVSRWNWQGSFSQHVQDAHGRNYWDFPYSGGISKQPALVEYETTPQKSRIRLSYALMLSSIPKSAGKLTFHAQIRANGSRRVPVSIVVR